MGKGKKKEVYIDDTNIPLLNIPSISSLHNEKQIKVTNSYDIYKTVLNKCIEKIIYTNRHTDKTFIIFEVPKILIGQTSYDMKSCIHYIINNITTHGYYVQFIEPFYIYIDWGSKHTTNGNIRNENTNEKHIESKTKEILKHFPGINKVEYIYEDVYLKQKKREESKKPEHKVKEKTRERKKK
jgi:hypothetical protein